MKGFGALIIGSALLVPLTGCGESESAREARAMQAATPQRLRPDGSIQLTDADRKALGLVSTRAKEAELPESALRFGRVLSPPANEGQVVSPVTGRVARPPFVQLGASVSAGAALLEIVPVLDTPDRISVGTQSAERVGQIEAADREVAKAEMDAARARELSPQIVSAAKLQEAETALATSRATRRSPQRPDGRRPGPDARRGGDGADRGHDLGHHRRSRRTGESWRGARQARARGSTVD